MSPVPHDPNRKYRDVADAEHWSGHFRREGRDVWEHRHRLLAASGAGPGMTVMDLGAGTGAFCELLLERVGASGRVHAIEVVDHFVHRLEQLATRRPNLSVHRGPEALDPGSVALAVCIDTYHHLTDPAPVLAATAAALAPGGALLLVDLAVDEDSPPSLREHVRADQDTVERELAAAGFELERRLPALPENYVLRFRRS